jgi:phosphoglycolate phosphatase-like HAD superfamily hydrolase
MSAHAQSPIHVYVDIDDTIVRSVGTKRIAIPGVIQHVRDLHAQGAILYCWSAGGADYARASAEEFGLAGCFVAFLTKPNVMIDDQSPAEWPRSLLVHPWNVNGQSADDYRARLK